MKFLTLRYSVVLASLVFLGCAQQRIREETTAQLRSGNYEAAIAGLEKGVAQYPESATLRAGLNTAKSEAVARLVAEAAQFRAVGKFDEAEKSISRGLSLEPANARLLTAQTELLAERKRAERIKVINAMIASGAKTKALDTLEVALREEPRKPELLALRRRLELELRLDSGEGTARSLADKRPITLDFRNAPLGTVLDAVTKGSGISFVLDRDVKQDTRVTVYLRNARVEDAVDLLASANQLAQKIIDEKTVLIYPNTPEKQREYQEQVIRVFNLANADAKSTAAFLKAMLRIKDPFVDEKANLLSIRETPDTVALAERLVALHDIGDAEVMMEVEILEIKTSRLTELGINFPNNLSLTPLPATGSTGLTLSSLNGINNDRIGVSVAGLLINLRREVGDFNILANPRIRAKNREKAHILIGDKVPVITSTSSATGFIAESVSYLDVGLKLDVEPLVSPDDEVTIKLGLEVSTLAKEIRTTAGSLAYQIGTRNANTTLRLRDGETQILAGLISNEDRSTSNRIPGLGDLPIAGRLFSSQKDDLQRTELVLAITPRILRSASRPDLAQAELWIGTELSTKLRPSPLFKLQQAKSDANLASATSAPAAVNVTAASMPAVPANAPPAMSWASPSEVKVGEVFSVTLNLASGIPLRGAPFEVVYANQYFDVLDVSEGDFFKQEDGVTSFTHAVNSATGRVGVAILRSDATGATGKSSAVTVRLKAKAPGEASLNLTSFKPLVLSGESIPIELQPLKIQIR